MFENSEIVGGIGATLCSGTGAWLDPSYDCDVS